MPLTTKNLDLPQCWSSGVTVVYDGDCPLCSRYADMVRLREQYGQVRLIDARSVPAINSVLLSRGLNLDDGMAVIHDSKLYFGAEALTFVARISSNATPSAWITSEGLARWIYPVLKGGRSFLLWLIGRKKLNKGQTRL